MEAFSYLLTTVTDLFFPRSCVVCGRQLGGRERAICLFCLADFPYTRFCKRDHNPMADKFNALIERKRNEARETGRQRANNAGVVAGDTHLASGIHQTAKGSLEAYGTEPMASIGGTATEVVCPYESYAYATALFYYSSTAHYGKIPQGLKYDGNMTEGRLFSRMLGKEMQSSSVFADVDLVMPVPLHWARRWKRGYNQAEVIARELAKALSARLVTNVLRRTRHTRSQTTLTVEEKARNVAGAFSADRIRLKTAIEEAGRGKKKAGSRQARRKVETEETCRVEKAGCKLGEGNRNRKDGGRQWHIVIVDDVFTTGSTMLSCYDALRLALAEIGIAPKSCRISVATLAFVYSG